MFENAFHLFHISPYKPTSVTSTITALRKGLPISCLDMFQQKFHIPLKTICSLLSYQNSLISSDIKKNRNLPPLISERLLLLTETLLKCSAYFDNEKVFEYWLYRPSILLKNQPPFLFLDSELGLKELSNIIRQLEHGMTA